MVRYAANGKKYFNKLPFPPGSTQASREMNSYSGLTAHWFIPKTLDGFSTLSMTIILLQSLTGNLWKGSAYLGNDLCHKESSKNNPLPSPVWNLPKFVMHRKGWQPPKMLHLSVCSCGGLPCALELVLLVRISYLSLPQKQNYPWGNKNQYLYIPLYAYKTTLSSTFDINSNPVM